MNTTHRFPRRAAVALLAAGALTLAGCSTGTSENAATAPPTAALESYGLTGLDAPEIIEELDTMPVADRPDDLIASVQPSELVLTSDTDGVTTLPIPEDRFYLSVAPYQQRTHDCYFHSLTTCLGELSGEQVDVTVTDQQSGEVVLEETRTTFDNGFTGIWLPRDLQGTIEVSHAGRTASAPISTVHDDDLTCLTTLELT